MPIAAATPQIPRCVSVREAAGLLGVSEITIRRMVQDGLLPGRRVRARVVVPVSAIDAIIDGPDAEESRQ